MPALTQTATKARRGHEPIMEIPAQVKDRYEEIKSRPAGVCCVTDLWITCALEFRGRWQAQWQPHHYTFLYFHDEAVSFAAGHRPCAECRRESYNAYRTTWAEALGVDLPSARVINKQLHAERIVKGTHRRRLHPASWSDLPDGAFVLLDAPAVVIGSHLAEWTAQGYRARHRKPRHGSANVITPPSTIAALRAGYPVQIDDAAR